MITVHMRQAQCDHGTHEVALVDTWKLRSALSLSLPSTGESTGTCSVNLVSNWLTSSSPCFEIKEIAHIKCSQYIFCSHHSYHTNPEWRLNPLGQQIIPLYLSKEVVGLGIVGKHATVFWWQNETNTLSTQ